MPLDPDILRVVNLLKHDHQHPRLNDKIRRVLGKSHTPAAQFKIKQEIVRLAKPCRRVLDFRSKMSGVDADQFEFHDMLHHLDQQSAQELKKEYDRYSNVYTEGVYEHVQTFFSTNKQALIDAQAGLKANIQFTRFGQTIRRQEERMHLASPISIARLKDPSQEISKQFVPSDNNLENATLAVTSDISQTGLCIRTKQHVKPTDLLAISFDGLAKQLLFKQKYVLYRVVKVILDEGSFRVALKIQNIQSNQEFADYIKNLIFSHKHKYKVNIDNILESVQSKGHEQYFVACSSAAHLFFDRSGKLQYCLSNPDLGQIIDFFGEKQASYLPEMFEKSSLLRELDRQKQLFYMVLHSKSATGKDQYIGQIADGSALAKSCFKQICADGDGLVFKLTHARWHADTAMQKTSVPEQAQEQYGSRRIHRYSSKVSKTTQQLQSLVSVAPVYFSAAAANLCEQSKPVSASALQTLPAKPLAQINVDTQDKRHEDRFAFETHVLFAFEGADYRTKTRNLSATGLSIEIGHKLDLPVGTQLDIGFEEFVERTAQFNLSKCSYKVVYVEDGVMGVSNREDGQSDARIFWERLILAKLDSFVLPGREKEPYGLNRALRNMASANTADAVAFFNIKQNKPNLLTIALPNAKANQPLWADASKHTQHIFKTWFYAPGVVRPLMLLCETFIVSNHTQNGIAIVAYKKQGVRAEIFHSKLIDASNAQIAQLPNLARVYKKRGCELTIFAIEIKRSREEYRRYYTDELNYLKRFAAHKGETLYANVRAVTAMMTFVDITKLMLGTLLIKSEQ